MLYVTTRNDRDTFTVQHALIHDRGPDGGQFVPFHNPVFSKEEVVSILAMPFDRCIAQILNRLWGLDLTGWDITFHAGRYPVRIHRLGYRLWIAEGWHNPDWRFERLVQNLSKLVSSTQDASSQWIDISVRIAVYCAVCGECSRNGISRPVDFALVSGDFSAPMAAWYARSWGFPIGNIICCCNENGNLWDLFANGQMRTDDVSISTHTPDGDIILPDALEQLIFACGGSAEVMQYLDACQQGRPYFPSDALLNKLRQGMYVCVVGNERVLQTISRAYSSRNYLLSPYDALCYCGVSDYRILFAETGNVLLFSEKSPICDQETVAAAMNIPAADIKNFF